MEIQRQKIINESYDDVDTIALAMASGNYISCVDTSASMTWVGTVPNRPYDIAIALGAFTSEIASPIQRYSNFFQF